MAIDGNFHHRHLAKAGSTADALYEPVYFLSKELVNSTGERIEAARKGKAKKRKPKVPDEAVDTCRDSYRAAKGDQETAAFKRCDINGLMVLVCRHDIPLAFTDIDSPGEQQKYAVALIEHLLTMIPEHATVTVFYDIGCVLHRSLEMVCCYSCVEHTDDLDVMRSTILFPRRT